MQVTSTPPVPSEASQPATQTPRRPAGKSLATLTPAGRTLETSSDEDEPSKPYNVEWKLSINTRRQAGESEPGIVVSPQSFWKRTLKPKLDEACAKKPCEVNKTDIIIFSLINISLNLLNLSIACSPAFAPPGDRNPSLPLLHRHAVCPLAGWRFRGPALTA